MASLPTGFSRLPSGRVRWRVQVAGRRLTGTADTLLEAKRERAQAELDAGGLPVSRVTVAELVDMWQLDAVRVSTTAENHDRAIKLLPDEFTSRRADQVDARVVAALWRQLETADVAPHTIIKARSALSQSFEMGIRYGLVGANPVRAAKPKPPPRSREVTPPAGADVRRLIGYFEERERWPYPLWIRIMSVTGARPGEICALRWSGLDAAAGTLRVGDAVTRHGEVGPGKNKAAGHRTVRLDPVTISMFGRHERVVGCPWIFTRDGREPWNPAGVGREIEKALKKLGIKMRPYDLRHFAATEALQRGEPIESVAHMLGDNPATVYKRYAHAIPARSRVAWSTAAAIDGA